MTHASSLLATKATGDKLEASEVNALDAAVVASLPRTGTTPLTANVKFQLAGHTFTIDCTDNVASAFYLLLGTADCIIDDTFGGAAKLHITANKMVFDGTSYPVLGSRTETRCQRGRSTDDTNFAFDPVTCVYLSSAASGQVHFELEDLIDGATMTGVTLTAKASYGGSYVTLPGGGDMPHLDIYKLDSGGTLTLLGTTTDASGTVGAFNASHDTTVGSLTEVISSSNRYFAFVFAPGASNYVASTYGITRITAAMTCTSLRP